MRQASSETQANPAWDASSATHLLSRASFGGSPEEVARLAAIPMEKAVDTLLSEAAGAGMPARPDWVKDPWINTERRYADTMPPQAAEAHRNTRKRYAAEMNDLRAWSLQLMIVTTNPLRELMTLFWHGHFATAVGKVNLSQAMFHQDEILRREAMGNFRSLVTDVTLSPAMMMYLDLEDSDKAKPNENYARELLELFTVGIGHYSEKDIKETARALTGWTLDGPKGAAKARATASDTPRDFARDGLIATFANPTILDWPTRGPLAEGLARINRIDSTGIDALDFVQRTANDTLRLSKTIGEAVRETKGAADYGPFELSQSLKLVAQMIAAEVPTRVFYVTLSGFDTHAAQANRHAALLQELSQALATFHKDLKARGHLDRTLVMTFSEFGRRVAENKSAGTDHGTANAMFLMAGSIKPGLHGERPNLSALDESGDLVHRLDFRSVYAAVLSDWFGSDASRVLDGRFDSLPILRTSSSS